MLSTLPKKGSPLPVLAPVAPQGVAKKPGGCEECVFRTIGSGFVPDFVGSTVKMAIVLEAPNSDDILESRALSGKLGSWWLNGIFLRSGYTTEDLLISSVLRCKPPGYDKYPQGKTRVAAEKECRKYDSMEMKDGRFVYGGLAKFAPDMFVITEHPKQLLAIPAYRRLIRADMKKAWMLVEAGYRVCVLAGDKAMHLVYPQLGGGVKRWRGHYVAGKWPLTS